MMMQSMSTEAMSAKSMSTEAISPEPMLMGCATADLCMRSARPRVSADVRPLSSFSSRGEGESTMNMNTSVRSGLNPATGLNPVVSEAATVTTLTFGYLCTDRHGVHTGGFEAKAAEYHAFGKGLIHASWAAKPKAHLFQHWKSAI